MFASLMYVNVKQRKQQLNKNVITNQDNVPLLSFNEYEITQCWFSSLCFQSRIFGRGN